MSDDLISREAAIEAVATRCIRIVPGITRKED